MIKINTLNLSYKKPYAAELLLTTYGFFYPKDSLLLLISAPFVKLCGSYSQSSDTQYYCFVL